MTEQASRRSSWSKWYPATFKLAGPRANSFARAVILAAFASCSERSSEAIPSRADESVSSSVSSSRIGSDSSVRAYIDPVTGQLREPTPEDIAKESAESNKKKAEALAVTKPSEPREVILPNGAITIQLDDSAQQPLIGCVQKNGDVKMDHDCDGESSRAPTKRNDK
jgi:hypothetical protein